MYAFLHTYIYICICKCICIYKLTYTNIYTPIYIYGYIYVYIHIDICMHMYKTVSEFDYYLCGVPGPDSLGPPVLWDRDRLSRYCNQVGVTHLYV